MAGRLGLGLSDFSVIVIGGAAGVFAGSVTTCFVGFASVGAPGVLDSGEPGCAITTAHSEPHATGGVVIRPIELPVKLVNHIAWSGPAVMTHGPVMLESEYVVTTPAVVMRSIRLLPESVIH